MPDQFSSLNLSMREMAQCAAVLAFGLPVRFPSDT